MGLVLTQQLVGFGVACPAPQVHLPGRGERGLWVSFAA